jgi:hypothetical protein
MVKQIPLKGNKRGWRGNFFTGGELADEKTTPYGMNY